MQKRSNPFATKTNPFKEEVTPVVTPVEEEIEESFEEEPVEVYIPQPTPKQQPKTYQTAPSNRYNNYDRNARDNNREKYTSTMDKDLRREIKFACVTKGIMFAQFVEEACQEKLRRERGR